VRSAECRYSLAGQDAQATHLQGILGVTMPGGFAEYFKAPARNLLELPEAVPFDAGGLTSCAVITAVHAYRKSGLTAGDTAVVLGVGGIGLLLVQLLSSVGVQTVAVSRSTASLEFAAQAGADLSLLSDAADNIERIREIAGGGKDGADCIFEMVGLAGTMKAAADYTMRGGRIVVIGEEAEFPAIDSIQIAQRELQIIGSRNGGRQDALDAIEMMATGVIRPRIAETFALDNINDAMDFVRRGDAHGRVVVTIK
jgi:D-arabinose 1-dehydrogenase-like Zn-dependent alcohol dehydrogenase